MMMVMVMIISKKNRLTMNQTYTHEFQCQYELQRYPFDLQARTILT